MFKYSDLTPTERHNICNGCGAKGGWIKPPNFLFKASCNQHDFYYWRGGTEEDRHTADHEFYKMMKIDANDCKRPCGRIFHKVVAFVYYKAVRIFGKKHFNHGKMKTREDISLNKVTFAVNSDLV